MQSHQNITSVDSQAMGPSIEDRLENTEKLIQEMNNKFDDLTSPKQSAKNEFNMLVQTLTMNSALQDYNADSDTSKHPSHSSNSQNSSFDEETLNLNQRDLSKYFAQNLQSQNTSHPSDPQISQTRNKNPVEKAQFSNSRYSNIPSDDLDQQNFNFPLAREKAEPSVQESLSDQLYQKAKDSISKRRQIMSSQQDTEFLENIDFDQKESEGEGVREVDRMETGNRRVQNILRNKQNRNKRRVNEEVDEDSCQIQMSEEFDQEFEVNEDVRGSRNRLEGIGARELDGKEFHQTTSSANLVLYDSGPGMSSQSPNDYLSNELLGKFVAEHRHMRDQNESDEDDLLQNDNVAGKLKHKILDENVAYIDHGIPSDDSQNLARYRSDFEQYETKLNNSQF